MPKINIILEDYEGDVKIRVASDTKIDENTVTTPAIYLGGELLKRLQELHEAQPVVDAEVVSETPAPAAPATPDANNG